MIAVIPSGCAFPLCASTSSPWRGSAAASSEPAQYRISNRTLQTNLVLLHALASHQQLYRKTHAAVGKRSAKKSWPSANKFGGSTSAALLSQRSVGPGEPEAANRSAPTVSALLRPELAMPQSFCAAQLPARYQGLSFHNCSAQQIPPCQHSLYILRHLSNPVQALFLPMTTCCQVANLGSHIRAGALHALHAIPSSPGKNPHR